MSKPVNAIKDISLQRDHDPMAVQQPPPLPSAHQTAHDEQELSGKRLDKTIRAVQRHLVNPPNVNQVKQKQNSAGQTAFYYDVQPGDDWRAYALRKRKAFIDIPDQQRLATKRDDYDVVMAMVGIAQKRQWHAIQVEGTQQFKQRVWLIAQHYGIEVQGYQPDKNALKIAAGLKQLSETAQAQFNARNAQADRARAATAAPDRPSRQNQKANQLGQNQAHSQAGNRQGADVAGYRRQYGAKPEAVQQPSTANVMRSKTTAVTPT